MKLAIIGTAGRKDDAPRMSRDLYAWMYRQCLDYLEAHEITELVSGGAAWVDHLAVSLFLGGEVNALTLHLPAPYTGTQYMETRDGGVTNYWHRKFSDKVRANTLLSIGKAEDKGARLVVHQGGFKDRNLAVGKADALLAFTFGTQDWLGEGREARLSAASAGLKPGGTSHCWNNSRAAWKDHVCLR